MLGPNVFQQPQNFSIVPDETFRFRLFLALELEKLKKGNVRGKTILMSSFAQTVA